jgi:hypothetical protein
MAVNSTSANRQHRGGIRTNSMADDQVTAAKLSPYVRQRNVFHYDGKGQPLNVLAAQTAFASGADATEHIAVLPRIDTHLHYWPVGAATIKGPMASASGVDLTLDQTNTKGCNYVPGGIYGPHVLTVPDVAYMISLKAKLTDKRIPSFAVGFRKNESVQAAIDDYDEAAWLDATASDISTKRILNNAATTVLSTGKVWNDNETHEFEVHLRGRLVYFFVDGKQVGIPHTFDLTEVVMPFIYYVQNATPSHGYIVDFKCGPISEFDTTPGKK